MTSMSKRNDPPRPPDEPGGQDRNDFTVVNLALWAGDYLTAESLLTGIVARGASQRRRLSPVENPVLASARRILRQLRLRMTHYRSLAGSAGLPAALVTARDPLRSGGRHLHAIISAESEREYELRCYVCDLTWEAQFYARGAELTRDRIAQRRVNRLGYGDPDHVDERGDVGPRGDEPVSLDVAWASPDGPMFLQVELSDFCTCTARGLWTDANLPDAPDPVVAIYQRFLDTFDPMPAATAPAT